MDDLGNLLYILFLVIYVVSRFIGKKKAPKQGKSPGKAPRQESETTERPTFEDLLREFTQQGESRPEKKAEKPVGVPVEEEVFEDDYVTEKYQEAVDSAKELKTLDEQVNLNEPLKKNISFEAYEKKEEEKGVSHDIFLSLSNPEDARRAIVLKEILDTKF
jgi:hypothetical protein